MKKSGFTLIELIFVIVIIGLLAAVAVPKFLATKKNAETANFPSVGHQLVTKAEEQFNLLQQTNLKKIFTGDKEMMDYNKTITQNPKFKTELNETDYSITYGTNNNVCLDVNRSKIDVNITPTAQTKTYIFQIKDLNLTCNQE